MLIFAHALRHHRCRLGKCKDDVFFFWIIKPNTETPNPNLVGIQHSMFSNEGSCVDLMAISPPILRNPRPRFRRNILPAHSLKRPHMSEHELGPWLQSIGVALKSGRYEALSIWGEEPSHLGNGLVVNPKFLGETTSYCFPESLAHDGIGH